MTINLSLTLDQIIIWILVGLVAGALAGRVALGRDLGLLGDIVAAFLGGFISGAFHWSIVIVGHPIISAMIIAFIGAFLLLFIVRLFGGLGRGSRRRAYWS